MIVAPYIHSGGLPYWGAAVFLFILAKNHLKII